MATISRYRQLEQWLCENIGHDFILSDAIGDASSRQYFRVILEDGSTKMLMDAPPDLISCQQFLNMSKTLDGVIRIPSVLADDVEQGFILLEDFGNKDLQSIYANGDEQSLKSWYRRAIDELIRLQVNGKNLHLPMYTPTIMAEDLRRFEEWYIPKAKVVLSTEKKAICHHFCESLVKYMATIPSAPIHFDYHCRNPMATQGDHPFLGVIDFQDARLGALPYDLASLLKDSYAWLPEDFRLDKAIYFWDHARKANLPVPASFDEFYQQFEWVGVFRHVRTTGTFARLAYRDGKKRYLADMEITLKYLRETCHRYQDFHAFYRVLNKLSPAETPEIHHTSFPIQHLQKGF